MKSKTLPSLRISQSLFENLKQALKKLNEDSILEITQADFIRIALSFTSQQILNGVTLKIQRE